MRVVITGGNRGLGLALAKQYAGRGDEVIVGCRDPKAAPIGVAHRLDMGDPGSIEAFASALGDRPVDVLINNAGIDARAAGAPDAERDALHLGAEPFALVLQVNTIGPMSLVQLLADNLREARGRVVNISSQVGSFEMAQRIGRDVSYTASKAALNMVSLKLAQAFQPDGVIVVAMHPGFLRTDMGGPGADLDPDDAAGQIVATVDSLTLDRSGAFIRWDGTTHPW